MQLVLSNIKEVEDGNSRTNYWSGGLANDTSKDLLADLLVLMTGHFIEVTNSLFEAADAMHEWESSKASIDLRGGDNSFELANKDLKYALITLVKNVGSKSIVNVEEWKPGPERFINEV